MITIIIIATVIVVLTMMMMIMLLFIINLLLLLYVQLPQMKAYFFPGNGCTSSRTDTRIRGNGAREEGWKNRDSTK